MDGYTLLDDISKKYSKGHLLSKSTKLIYKQAKLRSMLQHHISLKRVEYSFK